MKDPALPPPHSSKSGGLESPPAEPHHESESDPPCISSLFQRRDRLRRLTLPCQIPIAPQLTSSQRSPFQDQYQRSPGKLAAVDSQRLNLEPVQRITGREHPTLMFASRDDLLEMDGRIRGSEGRKHADRRSSTVQHEGIARVCPNSRMVLRGAGRRGPATKTWTHDFA